MKHPVKFLALVSCLTMAQAFAQDVAVDPARQIYPFKPYSLADIRNKISYMTEEKNPLMNVYEMESRELMVKNSTVQPWAGYFWSLVQGQVANTYQDKSYFQFWDMLGWEGNINRWRDRRATILSDVLALEEKDLARLAPSEKYDILMGDPSFDLTSRTWNNIESFALNRKSSFLSSIEIPDGYRIPNVATGRLALWEGICHGWALAAGVYARPANTVNITLPNGKVMPFYPDDLKALTSLMFANSTVQDSVLVEGLRCDDKRPDQDEYGRHIDTNTAPKEGEEFLPKCADVHPAVWHASIVNLTGLQGRSFVVEIDYHQTVNNHPLSGYKFKWFNPKTGRVGKLEKAMIDLANYKDPYKDSRSPLAVKLVGVDMEMAVIDWVNPKAVEVDSAKRDPIKKRSFMYDLELDAQGNIVGGQWRATRTADSFRGSRGGARASISDRQRPPRIKQPDFFWVAPKNFTKFFQPLPLKAWDGKGLVPKSWQPAARAAHGFMYQRTRAFGFNEKCEVVHEVTGAKIMVPCELKEPRPQPLINVVNQLINMSREK